MKIDDCINNYINGNLSDAIKAAKQFRFSALVVALRERGHSPEAAVYTAHYLKHPSPETYYTACRAEVDELRHITSERDNYKAKLDKIKNLIDDTNTHYPGGSYPPGTSHASHETLA